ncbi:hypothetical protein SAMN05421640_0768 [Ekhidna lutea]|uniref:Uncharacterized protein n=1 Tax=Ekhidna lutea TaxID=447679 RepID=A0A239FPP3_EKHLU|nr:hypothetical protein [Ekhidna lutea]SNS58588.1 hypothetical protein SAMN05421640_0768 [Ekhidna lutea]
MKTIILSFAILASNLAFSQTLPEIRSAFHEVVLNPKNSRNFHQYLKQVDRPTATEKAYQAVSEALLAQVVWNPFNKLAQVIKYDKEMSVVVAEDPENIEIRFLRLAIEYNLPSFLGMSEHLEEDAAVITENLSNIHQIQLEPSYSKYIIHFLSQTGLCSSGQISLMKERLALHQ